MPLPREFGGLHGRLLCLVRCFKLSLIPNPKALVIQEAKLRLSGLSLQSLGRFRNRPTFDNANCSICRFLSERLPLFYSDVNSSEAALHLFREGSPRRA